MPATLTQESGRRRDAIILAGHFGTSSSGHWAARGARTALEQAGAQVAALLNCQSDEIVFTSGGSEANNLALKGAFISLRERAQIKKRNEQ